MVLKNQMTGDPEKRKYKKHKEGFKIGISFKLNTKLKGISILDGGYPIYPVYVEVRARKQMTFFRSHYNFYVIVEDFDDFLKHDIARSVLEFQSKEITQHLIEFEQTSSKFDINEWLRSYQEYVNQQQVGSYLLNSLRQELGALRDQERIRVIKEAINFPHNNSIFELDYFKYLIAILEVANEPQLSKITAIISTYQKIKTVLEGEEKDIMSPLNAIFMFSSSLNNYILIDNIFIVKYLENIFKCNQSIQSDYNVLVNFLQSSKKFD